MVVPTLKLKHLYHGAVLALLLDNECPVKLMLIEKNSEDWGAYQVDSQRGNSIFFCKYSSTPIKNRKRTEKEWQFTFTATDINRLLDYKNRKNRNLLVALICIADKIREVCILYPEDLKQLLGFFSQSTYVLYVTYAKDKSLRVKSNGKELTIARNRINKLSS